MITARALRIVNKFYPDVTTVKDAVKSVTIEVTKRDASSAKVKNHKDCALAVACQRSYDGAIVSLARAYLIRGTTATRYEVRGDVSRELTSFDRGGPFEAGEYTLHAVDKAHGFGAGNNAPAGRGADRRPRPYHMTAGVRTRLNRGA